MKTILYVSVTATGQIGEASADQPVPQAVLADYMAKLKQSGNIIMGWRTYDDLVKRWGGTAALTSAGEDLVVLSSKPENTPDAFVVSSPEAALKYVKDKGHDQALIGGGAATYNAFLRQNLVDELYINVIPLLSAKGLNLALADNSFRDVQLLDTKTLGEDVVQMHFAVKR
jgi:dihydrofolate reductase